MQLRSQQAMIDILIDIVTASKLNITDVEKIVGDVNANKKQTATSCTSTFAEDLQGEIERLKQEAQSLKRDLDSKAQALVQAEATIARLQTDLASATDRPNRVTTNNATSNIQNEAELAATTAKEPVDESEGEQNGDVSVSEVSNVDNEKDSCQDKEQEKTQKAKIETQVVEEENVTDDAEEGKSQSNELEQSQTSKESGEQRQDDAETSKVENKDTEKKNESEPSNDAKQDGSSPSDQRTEATKMPSAIPDQANSSDTKEFNEGTKAVGDDGTKKLV